VLCLGIINTKSWLNTTKKFMQFFQIVCYLNFLKVWRMFLIAIAFWGTLRTFWCFIVLTVVPPSSKNQWNIVDFLVVPRAKHCHILHRINRTVAWWCRARITSIVGLRRGLGIIFYHYCFPILKKSAI